MEVKDVECYVRDHVKVTVEQTAKKLKTSPETVRKHIETLMSEGLVEEFIVGGKTYYRLVAIGRAADKVDALTQSQKTRDEIDRFGMRWLKEHGYTPEMVSALSPEEHSKLVTQMNDDYLALKYPGAYYDYGGTQEMRDFDAKIDFLMDIMEASEKKAKGPGRRYVSEDEWEYRRDMVTEFIMEKPGATSKEIAANHRVDPRYGRMSSSVVHDLLMDMYSEDGSFIKYTKAAHGTYSWFVDGVPADIAERIRKRLDNIRMHEIDVAVGIPLTEPQVFHVGLDGEKTATSDNKDEKVSEHQPVGESVSETTEDMKETIYETDGMSEDDAEVIEEECSEEEDMEKATEEYIFEMHNTAVVRTIVHRCTEDEMKVAASVLAKAINAKVGVKISKYVFEADGGKNEVTGRV